MSKLNHITPETNKEVILGKTEQKEVFVEMKARGYCNSTIAKKLGVHRNTLINWGKELDVKIALHNARSLYYEQIVEKHRLSRENRLDFLGRLKTRAEKALSKKDFEKLPVWELVELSLGAFEEMRTLSVHPLYLEKDPDGGQYIPIISDNKQGEAKIADTELKIYSPDIGVNVISQETK